ncbi:uncharacterized protein LOC110889007 [Helianthus annuus]|uniref:uncharacterized protein LOC110889007 n=1 Tax=Helianthus annuus TaxID=4232 RepID=UPI000B8FE035|nr:uncharacterized protein LOC110889007 [Helianthus annuus]
MESKLHPALIVSNIKTHVLIILEKDSTHYTTWKTLFKVHCQIYEVLDHLSPKQPVPKPTAESSDEAAAAKAEAAVRAADNLWNQLDAVVLRWIYATVSAPLLHIILQPGQTTHAAWFVVESEFNDNKNTRAIFLGQEFANLSLENFSNMADYCQHAKHLAEQLKSVGSPVDDRMLVIKILTGLTEQYDSISIVLQNRDPLPNFNEVRSRLNMEEQKKKWQATRGSQAAATSLATTTATSSNGASQQQPSFFHPFDRGCGQSRGGHGRGRGKSYSGRGSNRYSNQQQTPTHPYIVFPSN